MVKKIIKLINNERLKIKINSSKACDANSSDTCAPYYDNASCYVFAEDSCTKDYAGCSEGANDICNYDYHSEYCIGPTAIDTCGTDIE